MRIRHLFERQRARNGLAATISRGEASCPATIRLGTNANQADTSSEFAVEANSFDVLIARSAYMPTGTVTEPVQDDQIAYTDPELGDVVLRVIIPAASQQCFTPCDVEQTELRVHCKKF